MTACAAALACPGGCGALHAIGWACNAALAALAAWCIFKACTELRG